MALGKNGAVRPTVLLSYAALIAINLVSNFVIIPCHVQLLLSASLTVYIGCHRSLLQEKTESMKQEDAMKFPLVASVFLFGLYLVFKTFEPEHINMLLKAYFLLIGTFAMAMTFYPFMQHFGKSLLGKEKKYTIPLLGDIEFDNGLLICLAASVALSSVYLKTKHWCVSNLFGISFSVQAIQQMSLGKFMTGVYLLAGLFFYDIFWVFGTDVMVSVATKFDAPIKLLFLRAFATEDTSAQFSMLGLGDIVLPGCLIALLLRFDARRAELDDEGKRDLKPFDKPYFNVNIVSYSLGLLVTVVVMYVFKAAQPALLYLVPACLGAAVLTALYRGELDALLEYEDEPPSYHFGVPLSECPKDSETKVPDVLSFLREKIDFSKAAFADADQQLLDQVTEAIDCSESAKDADLADLDLPLVAGAACKRWLKELPELPSKPSPEEELEKTKLTSWFCSLGFDLVKSGGYPSNQAFAKALCAGLSDCPNAAACFGSAPKMVAMMVSSGLNKAN